MCDRTTALNFPLGLIKYVVTFVTLGYAHKVSCEMYSRLPQLFVFLFDVLSVAVFVIRERFVRKKDKRKKADLCLNLYSCVMKYYLILSLYSLRISPNRDGAILVRSLLMKGSEGFPRVVFSIRGLIGLFCVNHYAKEVAVLVCFWPRI